MVRAWWSSPSTTLARGKRNVRGSEVELWSVVTHSFILRQLASDQRPEYGPSYGRVDARFPSLSNPRHPPLESVSDICDAGHL